MTCEYLTRIPPEELDLVDLAWLDKVAKVKPWGHSWQDLVKEEGYHFWRIASGGILATEILIHPGGKELYIAELAGHKVKPKLLWAYVNWLAKAAGCKWIGCSEVNEKLVRIMFGVGMRPVSVRMTKEI